MKIIEIKYLYLYMCIFTMFDTFYTFLSFFKICKVINSF
jgi:hypothetical protein